MPSPSPLHPHKTCCTRFSLSHLSFKPRQECDKNPDYMAASCARACGKCEVCSGPGDLACINRNRAKLGFLVYDAKVLDG